MENKTHWRKLVNPIYLGAYSLMDTGKPLDLTATIEKVVREIVKGTDGKKEECTVAYLKGQKPIILNRTNCKIITKIYNTPFIEDWAGKKITIYVANTKVAGEVVECLRIRDVMPGKELLTPTHEKWNAAKEAISNGSATIAQIKANFILSPDNETLLCQK